MWLTGLLVTLVSFQIAQFIYVSLQAFVGCRVGATLQAVCVGSGPVVFSRKIRGCLWQLRLLPWGAYTKFVGDPSDNPGESQASDEDQQVELTDEAVALPSNRFLCLPVFGRMLIMLVGPAGLLLVGVFFATLPVLFGSPQLVVNEQLPRRLGLSAVPGLTVAENSSTIQGQVELLRQTVIEFVCTIVTFKSTRGWGGYIGWLSTSASAMSHSFLTWSSFFGILIFGFGLMNLLPIPVLNGGHLVFLVLEGAFGRISDSVRITSVYCGLIILLLFVARVCLADLQWLVEAFRSS
jgi:membrane-associated protease RseP (regulator of RpoE activity)